MELHFSGALDSLGLLSQRHLGQVYDFPFFCRYGVFPRKSLSSGLARFSPGTSSRREYDIFQ